MRVPVIVRAVVIGFAAAAAGTLPWAALAVANVRYWPAVPWSVPPAVLYLWLWWRYMSGHGWPQSTADARRASLRANTVPEDVFGSAIFAGLLGLVTLLLFQNVMSRLVHLPAQQAGDLTRLSPVAVIFLVIMGSIVAGVVEEGAFRGYMQGPIERRHGPVVAILVASTAFGFAHFTHREVGLSLLPFFAGVGVIYGAMASLTNSIWPGLVLHAAGDIMGALSYLATGRAEWQAPSTPQPLVWDTGVDAAFVFTCMAFFVVGAAAVWAYLALAGIARAEQREPLGAGV